VLQTLNPATGNHVDELRYLFLTSQVELSDRLDQITSSKYHTQTDIQSIGVADADGTKCDRCWNYSTRVGQSEAHPLLCDRCADAVDGKF
jgi:isoleucyl-tRNA synthetase